MIPVVLAIGDQIVEAYKKKKKKKKKKEEEPAVLLLFYQFFCFYFSEASFRLASIEHYGPCLLFFQLYGPL